MAKKKKKDENVIELCEGVILSTDLFNNKEKRILTLLLKGFIVYLLTMGTIGFYLSAIKAEYNVVLCHIVVLVFAMLCSLLYYRLLTENLGYFVLLALFGSLVYLFRIYINSGFYAIVNMSVDNAAQYFDVDIQRMYNEQIDNRYVTITMVSLFIGIVLDILLNVYISRRMQYATAMFIVMFFNMIPLYMTLEPDFLYALMILAGISMAYVIKVSRHYSPQIAVKRNDERYTIRGKKKKEVFYNYDVKVLSQASVLILLFVAVITTVVSSIRPKEAFNVGYKQNKYKDLTMAAVGILLMDGWDGFSYGRDKGGLNSGELGAVSSIRLDYQTDLIVRIAPYSFDTIYLKQFVGQSYNPYENYWTGMDGSDEDDEEYMISPEAEALKESYENNSRYAAKGLISIRNIDGVLNGLYQPYYMGEIVDYNNSGFVEEVFYPRLSGNKVDVDEQLYDGKPYTEEDLYVPEENRDAIEAFVNNFDHSGSADEIADSLINYYQDNIPYTVKPGKTPRKKDFVNYFLLENRKGYCSHFASSAVLIFRYLGIPARYIEGYAISYYQMSDAELAEKKEYDDYYDGYSELGKTAVLQINVTDADAHAWVEIYTEDKGWHVVEVTPSSGEEEENEDFWDMFDNIVNNDNDSDGQDNNGVNLQITDSFVRGLVYAIMGIIGTVLAVFLIIRLIIRALFVIKFNKAGINDKLIIRYSEYFKKIRRRDKIARDKINYSEQIGYIHDKKLNKLRKKNEEKAAIYESEFMPDKIIDILERAGFSDKEISQEDYDYVCEMLF